MSCNTVMMKFRTFTTIWKNFLRLLIHQRNVLFSILCTLETNYLVFFLDFIIILFIVRSIVIWIWRVRMRQLISLIRNCEKKGLTITSRLSYHQIKSCLIHANDLQYIFGYIFIESMSRIFFLKPYFLDIIRNRPWSLEFKYSCILARQHFVWGLWLSLDIPYLFRKKCGNMTERSSISFIP